MRKKYEKWVFEALYENDGEATVLEVAKHIWLNNRKEIEGTEEFYSWSYNFRWGATALRKKEIMVNAKYSPKGVWQLVEKDKNSR